MEKVLLGGGCFWGIEHELGNLSGVVEKASGYAGGQTENPSYEQVCSGTTGHAEVVEVVFDPAVLELKDLLMAYFSLHDPTQVNRQGPDVGTQYRSCIYFDNPDFESTIQDVLKAVQEKYSNPLATEVKKNQTFWRAEEYHQCYLAKRS